jgi:predicted transcriptional regulator
VLKCVGCEDWSGIGHCEKKANLNRFNRITSTLACHDFKPKKMKKNRRRFILAGKAGRSKNVLRQKSKVQFDNRTTRQFILPILRRIDVGDHMAKIGRLVGLKRQHIKYYVGKLEKAKLVHRVKRSSCVIYELTDEGKNLLTSCDGVVFPSEMYRLDKCQVSFEIRKEGFLPTDFRKVEMQNWTAFLGLEQGVNVRHTTKSWIVHVEIIRGKNAPEVYGCAMNLATRVAVALSRKYGCLLGEGKFIAGELAVEDPVATFFGRYFTVRTDKRRIDHSWGPGELENLAKDSVIAYLQMPEHFKNIQGQVEALRNDIPGIVADALRRILFDAGNEKERAPKVSADGGKSYVS